MKLKYTFVTRKVAGQPVAIVVGEDAKLFNGMVKLNETAEFIFNMLKSDVTESEIINAIIKEYDVSKDEAESATKEFLNKLTENGLVE